MAAELDWAEPLVAVDRQSGERFDVALDTTYATSLVGLRPVRLPRNAWTGKAPGGTWYFNSEGIAIGGITDEGYNGWFILTNG